MARPRKEKREKKVRTTVLLRQDLAERLSSIAEGQHRSRHQLILLVLEEYAKKQENEQ